MERPLEKGIVRARRRRLFLFARARGSHWTMGKKRPRRKKGVEIWVGSLTKKISSFKKQKQFSKKIIIIKVDVDVEKNELNFSSEHIFVSFGCGLFRCFSLGG